MASKTQIANVALIHIGITKGISNVDTENSNEARTIKVLFDDLRDEVLREFNWPFARKYAALGLVAGTSDDPANGDWTYSYRFPSDCLAARRIVTSIGRTDPNPRPFAIGSDDQGQLIFTDEEDATLEYTWAVDDPARFDPLFRSALAWKVASGIAPALSRVKDILTTCQKMYMLEISKAQAAALNEAQVDPDTASEFERVRA